MVVCGAAHQNQRLVPLPQLQEEVVNVQKNKQTNKQDVGVEEEVGEGEELADSKVYKAIGKVC